MRAAFFLAILFALTGCLWNPVLYRAPLRDELVYARTADGWDVAMHHYRPGPGVPVQPYPVIVCHGISANERSWSLDADRSFPRFLAERGWDVWAIDLRGVGESAKPGLFDDKSFDYPFDAYVTQDVPAVIAAVLKRTGSRKVNWVGHSMGGMVIYAYVATYGDDKLKTVTTVGTPVAFDGGNVYFAFAQEYAASVSGVLFSIRDKALLPVVAPFVGPFKTRMEYVLWNYDNMNDEAARRMVFHGADDMAGGVLRQLATMFTYGRFESRDGAIDYLGGLSRMRVPLHVTAGMADNLGVAQNTLPAYEAAGSQDKRFRVFARANGYAADYGHNDLPVGDHSARDVYPALERWMRERQP